MPEYCYDVNIAESYCRRKIPSLWCTAMYDDGGYIVSTLRTYMYNWRRIILLFTVTWLTSQRFQWRQHDVACLLRGCVARDTKTKWPYPFVLNWCSKASLSVNSSLQLSSCPNSREGKTTRLSPSKTMRCFCALIFRQWRYQMTPLQSVENLWIL